MISFYFHSASRFAVWRTTFIHLLKLKDRDEAEKLSEKDLAIVVISGGGSALLCYPESECMQSANLYQDFLSSGGSVIELNTIRKHISGIKGGGLAKALFPATVISMILCDVPGDHFPDVASGPTYKDKSTIDDAITVLEKYNLTNNYNYSVLKEYISLLHFFSLSNSSFFSANVK